MKLSIVLSVQDTHFSAVAFQGDFGQNLRSISNLGYQGVELAIRNPAQINIPELERLLKETQLVVPAIGTGQAWGEERLSFTDPRAEIREAALARACAHIPFAASTGAQIIIGLLRGIVQQEVDANQAMDWLISALSRLCTAAQAEGVRVCVEPVNRYETGLINTTAEGLQMIQRVGAPNLGLLLDTFHMNIEEADTIAAIERAGDRLYHFHVADSNRWYPGAGHLDFRRVLAALHAVNYTGFVSGEFMPQPDPYMAAEQAIINLRKFVYESGKMNSNRDDG